MQTKGENMRVNFNLNGKDVASTEGTTIIEACRNNGVSIPSLCYHPALQPMNATDISEDNRANQHSSIAKTLQSEKLPCELCVVEVEYNGKKQMVLACCSTVKDGIKITTESQKISKKRQLAVEKLWAMCPEVDALKEIAQSLGVQEVPFKQGDSQCIQCGMCIQACREIIGANALAFDTINGNICAVLVDKEKCTGCGFCYDICPTGAINPEKELTERFREQNGNERLCRFSKMGLIPFAFCSHNYNCASCEVDQRYRVFLPVHPALIANAKKERTCC